MGETLLVTTNLSGKDSLWNENTLTPVKEKISGATANKRCDDDSLLRHEIIHRKGFP